MAGYKGWSMSNNAVSAYGNGEKPLSKWTKEDLISEAVSAGASPDDLAKLRKCPLPVLKSHLLRVSSWHHTSSHFNHTDFYSFDPSYLDCVPDYVPSPRVKSPPVKKWGIGYFTEWVGSRKHLKPVDHKAVFSWTEHDGKKSLADVHGVYFWGKKRLDSISSLEVLDRKPRKNSSVWKKLY